MEKTQYKIRKAIQPKAPPRNLIEIFGERTLVASLGAFGPSTYEKNTQEIAQNYLHPETREIISFRPSTTAESCVIASCDFGNKGEFDAKRDIFDPRLLQAGPIVRATEGFFANPPKDQEGNFIIDERKLKSYLNSVKPIKVNNRKVYIVPDNEALRDFGYAEYGTFQQGIQKAKVFAKSGLVMALEHTERPKNLSKIASSKLYKLGVNVQGFDSVKEPVLRVATLDSDRVAGGDELGVGGDYWVGSSGGCALGVLNKSAEGASQKNK